MNKILFSSRSDNWKTPSDMYYYFVNSLGCFDPCPYLSDFDGLNIEWKEKNFVNPPFSCISLFVDKCILEFNKGKIIYLLIPARTDTKYFRKLVNVPNIKIYFITGRLHFNDSGSAPFPSCLFVLNPSSTSDECRWIDIPKGGFYV